MALDTAAGADAAHAPAQPGKWRLGGALWLLGMPGVVAVVWTLLPTLKANEAPAAAAARGRAVAQRVADGARRWP